MVIEGIDISGTWSQRQADKVIERLTPAAFAQGLVLRAIDITTHSDTHPRRLISARPIAEEVRNR